MNETIAVDLIPTGCDPAWQVVFPGPNGGSFDVNAGDTDTINWVVGSAPIGAAISAVTFSPGQPGDVPWVGPTPSAPDWSTTDTDNLQKGDAPVSWSYTVSMIYGGVTYVSDPEITNKPPTGP